MIQIIRRLGAAESGDRNCPPSSLPSVRSAILVVTSVAVQIECRIDQLVNLLAALQAVPELVATSDLRVLSSNAKEKTVAVRLAVSGVVPRRLVAEKSQASKKAAGGAF